MSNINVLKVKRKKCFFSDLFIFVIYIVRCLGAYFPDTVYKRYGSNEPNFNNTETHISFL